MTALSRDSSKIVIAGASSLLGAELRSLLEESRFAASDFSLVDEDLAAGTLTEAGGEAAVIQPVEEGTFDHARFVFFTGSPDFTNANLSAARHSGAKVIDLSGATAGHSENVAWFPGLSLNGTASLFSIPSAAAAACFMLSSALCKTGSRRMAFLCFQPVSQAGRAGIEELESQTGQLLSFQGVGQPVFDAQVAFNLLDRFGSGSSQRLSVIRERIRREVAAGLGGKIPVPAIQVIHAPVFYGLVFSAWAELDGDPNAEQVAGVCKDVGFAITSDDSARPSNISAAGESVIQLAVPEADSAQPGTWWFWGAADNIRLPAANAIKLAEMLS